MVTFFILIPTVTMTPGSFMIQYQAVKISRVKTEQSNISKGICSGSTGRPGSHHNGASLLVPAHS